MLETNFNEYEDIINNQNNDREKFISVKQCLDTAIDGILIPDKDFSSALKRLLNAAASIEAGLQALNVIGETEDIEIPRPQRTAYGEDKRWKRWKSLLEKQGDGDLSFAIDDDEIKADSSEI